MDIEGDELKALKGAQEHIRKDSPKLLISIYHKNDHYFQIPKYINTLNKNYKFHLRYYGGELYPTEVVLFAIPKNKDVKWHLVFQIEFNYKSYLFPNCKSSFDISGYFLFMSAIKLVATISRK